MCSESSGVPIPRRRAPRRTGGMTLIELLVSMSVMLLVVGTLAGLAKGVQTSYDHSESYGTITQHARVVLERITRTVNGATASKRFPGVLVVADYDGSDRFPETLVVWHPAGAPAQPDGLPKFNELVIYCPNRGASASTDRPNQLMEITVPTDTRDVPDPSATGTWQTEIQSIRQSTTAIRVLLTPLVRTAKSGSRLLRGAVRFECVLAPSDQELTSWQTAGSQWGDAWNQLPWIHSLSNSSSTLSAGLRQARVRIEMQLARSSTATRGPEATQAVPFFASAAVYYRKTSEVIP